MKKVVVAALLLLASAISYGKTYIEIIVVPVGTTLTINTTDIRNSGWTENNKIKGVAATEANQKYTVTLDPGVYRTENFMVPFEDVGQFLFTTFDKENLVPLNYVLREEHGDFKIYRNNTNSENLLNKLNSGWLYAAIVNCNGTMTFQPLP